MVEQLSMLVGVVGTLAFIVSVIVQVIKGPLDKLPTDVVVIVLSIMLSLMSYFAYGSYAGLRVVWYQVVGTVILGFIVAFVAMYGWTKLKELWGRFHE